MKIKWTEKNEEDINFRKLKKKKEEIAEKQCIWQNCKYSMKTTS